MHLLQSTNQMSSESTAWPSCHRVCRVTNKSTMTVALLLEHTTFRKICLEWLSAAGNTQEEETRNCKCLLPAGSWVKAPVWTLNSSVFLFRIAVCPYDCPSTRRWLHEYNIVPTWWATWPSLNGTYKEIERMKDVRRNTFTSCAIPSSRIFAWVHK